jgi:hypothetical protein
MWVTVEEGNGSYAENVIDQLGSIGGKFVVL